MLRAMTLSLRLGAVLAVLPLAACLTDTRPTRERGGIGLFDRAPVVKGPAVDRCQSVTHPSCQDALYLAQNWARRLAPGDEVCLEQGVGDEPGPACHARARVADVAPGQLLIEVKEAQPGTQWFDRVESQVWFEESALVDLYLQERGY
jgi:hypothetical protein